MSTPPPEKPPVQLPPSAGGTGLAAISGMFIGWNLAAVSFYGDVVPAGAWIPGLSLAVFVVILLTVMQLARARMGIRATPASLRRQWLIVAVGFAVGVGVGFGFAVTGDGGG